MDCLKIINHLNEELDGLQKENVKLNITLEYINNECEETNKYKDMCGAWINFSNGDVLYSLYMNGDGGCDDITECEPCILNKIQHEKYEKITEEYRNLKVEEISIEEKKLDFTEYNDIIQKLVDENLDLQLKNKKIDAEIKMKIKKIKLNYDFKDIIDTLDDINSELCPYHGYDADVCTSCFEVYAYSGDWFDSDKRICQSCYEVNNNMN